jgi:uncharacterized protein YegP (UPF0339 family)
MRRPVQRIAMLAALVGALCLSYPAAHAQKDKTKGKQPTPPPSKAAVFELYKDKSGEFRFRFKDADGDLLATSGKGYKTKPDCQTVIDTIKSEAARAKVDDQSK